MVIVNNMNKKTGKGRKKIKIKKIEENNNRQVTFSKRRNELFKKAAELCVLTGAKISIIVNSPGGRVFAFGHPNVDALINTYLANEKNVDVDVEMGQSAEFWFDEPIDGMDVAQLEEYLSSLQELKRKVLIRADELMMMNNAPVLFGTKCAAASAWTRTECYAGSVGTKYSESTGTIGLMNSGLMEDGYIMSKPGCFVNCFGKQIGPQGKGNVCENLSFYLGDRRSVGTECMGIDVCVVGGRLVNVIGCVIIGTASSDVEISVVDLVLMGTRLAVELVFWLTMSFEMI
ncbi:agamous-like MADS-box protein AGL62 [Tanacetum coccineum]